MKRKIKTKLFGAFLGVTIASLAVAAVIAGFTMTSIFGAAMENNTEIGNSAAASSETALTELAVSDMEELSQAKADLINEGLSESAAQLQALANFIDALYTHGEEFTEVEFPMFKDVPAGQLALTWVLAGSDVTLADVRRELFLHGNVKWLYDSMMEVNPNITTIYYSSESGFATAYDAAAGQKTVDYYDGRKSDWYEKAKATSDLVISDTYEDVFGRGLTVSMAQPCYDAENKFVGVVGIDISLQELNADVQQTTVLEDGYAVLLGENGKMISAPGLTEQNQNNINEFLGSSARQILDEMAEVPNGAELTELDGAEYYAVWADVPLTGWSYVLMAPEKGIVAPAEASKAQIETISADAAQSMQSKIALGTSVFVGLFLLTLVAVVVISLRISRNITKPISELNEEVKHVGQGSLDYTTRIRTGDELEELGHSFEAMTSELKDYIRDLAVVTADKERISTELDVARQIQASMLPCIFPPFPEVHTFDIYATMQPAREVGGDFYDFYLLDSNHLAVVIADVSGKGVPAALFMVIAKTLIKNRAQSGNAPAALFEAVNNQLCENNDMNMFVTAFMGILEISTGRFSYANAGHNPPLLCRAGGSYETLPTKPGFVLGGMEGMKYQEQCIVLSHGDRVYLYTDGVTEAMDKENGMFGEARLVKALDETRGRAVDAVLYYIKEKIDEFAGGAEQFDDITMLLLERKFDT